MDSKVLIGVFVLVGFVFFAIIIGITNSQPVIDNSNNNSNPNPNNSNPSIEPNNTQFVPEENGYQVINLSFAGYNYSPNTFNVKVGKPVKIIADLTKLYGCYTSFIIPSVGVKKIFTNGDNTIEFTPEKKGTYNFSCYMGMGRGQIIASWNKWNQLKTFK